jgi:hypothetical protein
VNLVEDILVVILFFGESEFPKHSAVLLLLLELFVHLL